MKPKNIDYTLYLVTDRSFSESQERLEQHVKEAISGGVSVVQLREKHLPTKDFIELAERILKVTREAGVPLIINDRVDVAMAVDADGVHIGPEDIKVQDARRILGKDKLIGVTIDSVETARQAYEGGADYLGTEAIFETPTKKYTMGPLGLGRLLEIVECVPIPVVPIGGINSSNVEKVIEQSHPAGIACVSAIMAAKHPKDAAMQLRKRIEDAKKRLGTFGTEPEPLMAETSSVSLDEIKEKIIFDYKKIRASKPLIEHITDFVGINESTNSTYFIGAIPIVVHAKEEAGDIAAMASSVVLNPGTADSALLEALLEGGKEANKHKIPVILDPVGAGAVRHRTKMNKMILENVKISILRGNAGEIGSLSEDQPIRVTDTQGFTSPESLVEKLAYHYETTVAISGQRDYVSDGNRIFGIDNGSDWLAEIVGSGVVATSIIAAFAAVEKDPVIAAVAGYVYVGVAAEIVAQNPHVKGPASFWSLWMDQLRKMSVEDLSSYMSIVQLK